MQEVTIGDAALTPEQLRAVARNRVPLRIAPSALERMRAGREVVETVEREDRAVYGITRGLGRRVVNRIEDQDRQSFSRRMLRARAGGAGDPLPEEVVRAAMLARVCSMAWGGSGARPVVAETLAAMLNAGVHPVVPSIGSFGAADLLLMANVGLVAIGEGEAFYQGERLAGAAALAKAGIAAVDPLSKEGLALCSANSISAGMAGLALADLVDAERALMAAAALSFEAFRGNPSPYDARIAAARPAPGQPRAAEAFRALLAGGTLFDEGEPRRVQDPISLRCISQVHGALFAAIDFARPAVQVEFDGAGDNPLILTDDQEILSNGNFHSPALALAFDTLGLATVSCAQMAQKRIAKLMSAELTDLPAGLNTNPSSTAGIGIVGAVAELLVKEMRVLAAPATLHSDATYDVEDHAPMTLLAVRKLRDLLPLLHNLIACELVAAAQAFELRGAPQAGPAVSRLYRAVREEIPFMYEDRSTRDELARLSALVGSGKLLGESALSTVK
ncbi:MAG: aromatic amino acid lyase [Rhodovibrionaceae bacterium]